MGNKEEDKEEDISVMFKELPTHKPLIYDGTPDPNVFEDRMREMEKLLDALHCLKNWV